jgi:hypothetical protein
LPDALRGLRQGFKQFECVREVTDGLHIGRALDSSLACLLPVGNGLLPEACLRIVVGQQFRLGFYSL